MITFELYGVPRMRAGRPEVVVRAGSLGEAIAELERACPALRGSVIRDGRLLAAYRVSLNGARFVADSSTPVTPGDHLVLVAADAGG